MKKHFFDYDDEYLTCARTYATLCIYLTESVGPNLVTEYLNISPSRTQNKGEVRNGKAKVWPTAWFLESREYVQSKDIRQHVDWLLDRLNGKSEIIRELQNMGSRILISCFWESATGHGGPMLDAVILKRLAELNLGIVFDLYFDKSET